MASARTARNVEQHGTLDERVEIVVAFLRRSGGWVETSIVHAAHGYSNGMMGGVLAKAKSLGLAERRGRSWRARRA